MCICFWYHGTSKENADSILKSGFRAGTYFAKHLEDAVGYGGPYVFEVVLYFPGENPPWQHKSGDPVPSDQIFSLKRYDTETLWSDSSDRDRHVGYYNEYGFDYHPEMIKEEEWVAKCEEAPSKPLPDWPWMDSALEAEKKYIVESADAVEGKVKKSYENWPLSDKPTALCLDYRVKTIALCLDYRVLDELEKRGYDTGKVKLCIPKKV